ncbi:MAG: DUF378 domain-containing protein [Thermaerobacter sp.]|nr:DUF378 domain-containing protein [Thermaerobacter sp.]
MRRSAAGWVSFGLVAVGAANWGLKGFFGYDLVAESLGGPRSFLTKTVYAAVGVAGIYQIAEAVASLMSPDPLEELINRAKPEVRDMVSASAD